MRYFVKIVEAGSFSRASALIFVAQPALSHQIAELEEELGVVLLHRNARGVRPTVAGEALYAEACAILRQVEKLPDIVRSAGGGEAAGTVSLGMSSTLASFLAGPFMEACKVALPRVGLSFVSEDSMSLKTRIDGHTLDLAVIFEAEPMPGLMRAALFRQRLYLVDRHAMPGNPSSVELQQLGGLPLILPIQHNSVRRQLDRLFASAGITPNIVTETNILSTMLAAVHAGMGATILPIGAIPGTFGSGGVVATPIDPPIYQTASVVSSDSTTLTRAGEAVRDLLKTFVQRFLLENQPMGMERIEDC